MNNGDESNVLMGLSQVSKYFKVPPWRIVYLITSGKMEDVPRFSGKRMFTRRHLQVIRKALASIRDKALKKVERVKKVKVYCANCKDDGCNKKAKHSYIAHDAESYAVCEKHMKAAEAAGYEVTAIEEELCQ